ncbi:hypothetical protein CVT26_009067 [Gymnopilus dilepis]|uniref:Helicase C-terminal domain-containing protein n=1 Tax=Gymnopilus dilepis TaxID=231916 RepID=A0A409YAZ7_9AGAR|nr:hypothetical protein CVT26_009067 [Gymnopilus dilepis]
MHAIPNSKFYLPYRMGACCPRLDLKDPIPSFRSLEEWKAGKFTKFDICAKLVKHLLSRDDAPEVVVEKGTMKFPRLPAQEKARPATRIRKVLIYQEFICLGPLLRNVLNLYGITSVHIDGDTELDDRTKRVHLFKTDPQVRVFIFSRIGASGINLPEADVIIYVDQAWSGQEMRQARGRCHRQPQKNVVRCYHLLAENTADIILYGLALGKEEMMTAFLTQETGRGTYK